MGQYALNDRSKFMKVWKISISFFLFLLFIAPVTVFAASDTDLKPNVKMTDNGTITWKTIDTKATTGITWKTEGFTVKSYRVLTNSLLGTKEYGNPVYKKPYGKFYNKEEYYHLDSIENGKYYGTWTIPKTVVDAQIKNAGVSATTLKQQGGYLYLNAIFRTYHNGKAYSKYIYDFDGIKYAESWANPNDFRDHFDIPVEYHAEKVPVRIVYQELYDGELHKVKTTELEKQMPLSEFNAKDTGQVLWELLPAKMSSKYRSNKNVWAYKVTIQDIATGKTLSFPESSGSSKEVKSLVFQNNPVTNDFTYSAYLKEVNAFRNRDWEVPTGGLQISVSYKYYKKTTITPTDPNTKEIRVDYTDPQPPNNRLEGVIQADTKGTEKFDVEQAIPTAESTYSYVIGQKYLVSYTFTNYYGTKEYLQVTPSSDPKVPAVTKTVIKSYSYWKVTQLDVYGISHATVSNYALPNQKIMLIPSSSYYFPSITFKQTAGMKEPISGGLIVEDIQVQNDYLEIDGQVLMQNGWCKTATMTPVRLSKPSVIDNTILFQEGMMIDSSKQNGEWESTATITYKNLKSYGESQGAQLVFDVDMNDVTIHTPTVCDAQVEDVRKYNQLLHPNRSSAGLVLDRYFSVYLPTVGTHNNYKNYGYRNYEKYIARRQVRFPFDVYQGTIYVRANTWITLVNDTTQFYLPSWVKEGYYTAEFRAISINSDANQGEYKQEELANYDIENYIATDFVDIQVSGRIYSFHIYDITDYPLWQSVFRIKDSMGLTGNYYSVGIKDRNGIITNQNEKMTLPIMPGSHPNVPCAGAIPTGYAVRFSVETIGTMDGEHDFIEITPKFYYVSKNGKTREEVDLYYTETVQGQKRHLIKIGSDEDKKNTKSMYLGNPYSSVSEEEISQTASILNIPLEKMKNTSNVIYTFGNIALPWTQRTFQSIKEISKLPVANTLLYRSRQKWYGEYYLPADIHAVSKNISIEEYRKEHTIDYKEEFWKKDGYLIVNFEITTIQDGSPHLSYENVEQYQNGYCDMWKMEGFQTEKEDCNRNTFLLQEGDVVFYDLENSVTKDYVVGGTH